MKVERLEKHKQIALRYFIRSAHSTICIACGAHLVPFSLQWRKRISD
jgi:hypothetical protein